MVLCYGGSLLLDTPDRDVREGLPRCVSTLKY